VAPLPPPINIFRRCDLFSSLPIRVGSKRRGIAMEAGDYKFVAPDNVSSPP
jgi:hypothetical protein